jgi:hypothetical protein
VLFVEHKKEHKETFSRLFGYFFKKVANLDFTFAKLPSEAIDKLRENPKKYNILITDLLFPDDLKKESRVETYQVTQLLRFAQDYPRLIIVGISREDIDHNVEINFKDDGGEIYISKYKLKSKIEDKEIINMFKPYFAKKGYFLESENKLEVKLNWQWGDDLILDEIIEILGKNTIENIMSKSDSSIKELMPQYVSPGTSGTVILRIDTVLKGKDGPEASFLLKCDKNKEKIQKELERNPIAGELDAEIYIKYKTSKPIYSNGWYGLLSGFQDKAVTFLEWMQDSKRKKSDILNVLKEIFLNHLGKRYKNGSIITKNIFEVLEKSHKVQFNVNFNKSKILNNLSLLDNLAKKMLNIYIDPQIIENYIRHHKICDLEYNDLKKRTYICLCHGDLHLKNILITGFLNNPKLIDTASRVVMHWADDIAHLCADLWINSLDRVQGENFNAFCWESVKEWITIIKSWYNNTKIGKLEDIKIESNRNTLIALYWLRDNIFKIIGKNDDIYLWEFWIIFIEKLLVYSTDLQIPITKRCFALIIATELLKKIRKMINDKN